VNKIASKIFIAADGRHYRQWLGAACSCLLPGAAQFLAGRRLRGVLCFAGFQALATMLIAASHSTFSWIVLEREYAELIILALWIAVATDAAFHRFPRMALRRGVRRD
jgi:hypothetical protein